LARMEIYNALGVECLKAFCDSQWVLTQVRGDYKAYDPAMVAYLEK